MPVAASQGCTKLARPLRIGVVASSRVDGGAESYLRNLYEGLARRGHSPVLLGELPGWELESQPTGVTGKWSRRRMLAHAVNVPAHRERILSTARALHRKGPFDAFHLQYKR